MKLLLSSGGNGSLSKEQMKELHGQIYKLFGNIKEVVFISYAVKDQRKYTSGIRNFLWPLKDVNLIGIEEFGDPIQAIRDAKGIYIGGGNTFLLTDKLHKNNLIDILKDVIKQGVPYMGVSAGTNVACPTMMTTNDMPVIIPNSFETLELIDFQINAHYHEGKMWLGNEGDFVKHNGETRAQRIAEFHQHNEAPVIGLFEGSCINWKDDKGELKIGGGVIFKAGKDPKVVKRGAIINSNLDIL